MKFDENIYYQTKKIICKYLNNKFEYYTEDDVSDIVLKIVNKYDTYNKNLGSYSNWVINIAKNHMIDCLKKINKVDYFDSLIDFNQNTDTININHDSEIIYNNISTTISQHELLMFKKKYIDGYKNKEIANMFHITSSTVSNKINYIKLKIKNKGIFNSLK